MANYQDPGTSNTGRPSAGWFVLPLILFFVTIAGVVLFVSGIVGMVDFEKQYIYLKSDPPDIVVADEARTYKLYYEHRGTFQYHQIVTFTFTNTASGETHTSQSTLIDSNYRFNGVRGMLVGQVDLIPGAYEVTSDYLSSHGPELTFVFTPGMNIGGFGLGIVAFFVSIGALVSGIITLVVLIARRKQQLPTGPEL